ncbi:MAG: universal stress protein [Gammaproteobacteria bacterium]|jgi:nucleotide-binding universal stress UspA family protein|nr:universal stress protein [Gammaproteobacteria bacterium]
MHRDKNMIVALAGTKADAGLCAYAVMAAKWHGIAKVAFVHVLPNAAAAGERARAELEAQAKPHTAGLPASVDVSYEVLSGPMTDQLLAFAAQKKAEVLLVGHSRQTPGRSALARRLAMKAPCSVWMAPDGAPAALRRILVPIDFSEHSADALRTALSLAKLAGGAQCLPLHVYFNEAAATYEGYDQVLRGEEQAEYRRFIAPIDCRGIEVKPLFEEGANVSHAIGRVVQSVGADLIVMATRGRSRSAAILLGSATEEMIIETRAPLLAVKHFGAGLGVLEALLDKRFLHQGDLHTS